MAFFSLLAVAFSVECGLPVLLYRIRVRCFSVHWRKRVGVILFELGRLVKERAVSNCCKVSKASAHSGILFNWRLFLLDNCGGV